MRHLIGGFANGAVKVFVPSVYGAWFLKLGSDNFDGTELLIFVPVYILSLIGVWRITTLLCSLIERKIAGQNG